MSYVQTTQLFYIRGNNYGKSLGATATVGTLTDGSIDIKDKYFFDIGQRDNFYDISRIVRKVVEPAPTGRLLIIYDYFEHGTGDLFTVDSYVDVAGQMGMMNSRYMHKVDPDSRTAGNFIYGYLILDQRLKTLLVHQSTLETVDEITGNSFDFFSRQYDGTGASTVDVCKPGSIFKSDFEFYLGGKSSSCIVTLEEQSLY